MCSLLVMLALTSLSWTQSLSPVDRARGHLMLKFMKEDLEKHYYDKHFHGLDANARFKEADQQIDSAANLSQMFWDIGETLLDLNDSHTMFVPPLRSYRIQYGWEMMMVGDTCMVTAVQPGSDAEAKGLTPGTIIGAINRVAPTRFSLPYIEYIIYSLMPQSAIQISVLQKDGTRSDLTIEAKVVRKSQIIDFTGRTGDLDYWDVQRELERIDRLDRSSLASFTDSTVIWKMPEFNLDEEGMDKGMNDLKSCKTLILDLRNNPGGYEETLSRFAGHFFDHDVTLFYTNHREKNDSVVAHTQQNIFEGTVIVLVNSATTCAAEIFARTIQLTKRGFVVGDFTGGMAAEAQFFRRETGAATVVVYGTNITVAAITMPDGFRLERAGVVPDERILPTSNDLALGLDPVLAHALSLAGHITSAKKAAQSFPIEWVR